MSFYAGDYVNIDTENLLHSIIDKATDLFLISEMKNVIVSSLTILTIFLYYSLQRYNELWAILSKSKVYLNLFPSWLIIVLR